MKAKKKHVKLLNIYIVEDEPLITATVETALKKQGFKVIGDSDEFDEATEPEHKVFRHLNIPELEILW